MRRTLYEITRITFVLILFISLFDSCGKKEEEKNSDNAGAIVKIINPRLAGMVDYLELNATTTFLKKEIVRSPFQGYIESVAKNIGDTIKDGEDLFLLKTKEANALGNDAGNKYIVSVKARSNGILTKIFFHPGDYVADGEQIAEIANPGSMVVELNVPYQNNQQVRIGMQCKLFLPDGKVLIGSIAKALPSMDASAQTQTYLINCSIPEKLPENLNMTVKIPIHSLENTLVLPKSSVLTNEALSEFWVMKLIDDKTAVKVPVKKGIENDSLVQIIEPKLNMEDKIIFDGGYGLSDSAKVSIER